MTLPTYVAWGESFNVGVLFWTTVLKCWDSANVPSERILLGKDLTRRVFPIHFLIPIGLRWSRGPSIPRYFCSTLWWGLLVGCSALMLKVQVVRINFTSVSLVTNLIGFTITLHTFSYSWLPDFYTPRFQHIFLLHLLLSASSWKEWIALIFPKVI